MQRDVGLVDADLRTCLIEQVLGVVDGILGNRIGLSQPCHAVVSELGIVEAHLGLFDLRLGRCEIGSVLVDDRLIRTRIDFRADLVLLNNRIVVALEALNDAGHISADDDREHRIDGAGGGHRARHRPARDRRGSITDGSFGGGEPPSDADGGEHRERRQPGDQPGFSKTWTGRRRGGRLRHENHRCRRLDSARVDCHGFIHAANSACAPQPWAR